MSLELRKDTIDYLHQISISFRTKRKKKTGGALFDFLSGTFLYDEEQYILLNCSWYKCSEDLLTNTQKEFHDILKKHLIRDNFSEAEEVELLSLRWLVQTGGSLIREEDYSQEYSNKLLCWRPEVYKSCRDV